MKNLITFSIFILILQIGKTQSFSVTLGSDIGRSSQSFNFLEEGIIIYRDQSSLPDTVIILSEIRTNTQHDRITAFYYGFHGSLNLNWHLKKSFEFETGLGFRFSKFGYANSFGFTQTEVLSQDTFEFNTNINIQPLCNPNTPFDFRRFPSFNNYEIFIPVKVAYTVWDGDIKFLAGGTLSTLFNSGQRTQENFIILQDRCNFFDHEEFVLANDLFKNINLGLNAGIEFWLLRRLGIQVGIEKRVTNIFKDTNILGPPFDGALDITPVSKPFYFSLSLKYGFNRK